MTRDLHTLIYLLNLELREDCSRTGIQLGLQADMGSSSRSGRNRLKSGSSSRSGRDQEQQLKRTQVASMHAAAEAGGRRNRGAAAGSGSKRKTADEADAHDRSREQQLIRSGRKQRAAAEADAIRGKRTQSGSSSSAQRAVRCRITHGRRTRGK